MRLLPFIIFLFSGLFVSAQSHELAILFEGMETSKGQIMLRIIDEDGKAILVNVIAINEEADEAIFKVNLPTGRYAVSAFHDINSNEELDKNAFGVPRESYGFSNDARGTFGPPSREEQLFMLDRSKSITINLQ